jgi:ATP-dependent Lhr-like helicase
METLGLTPSIHDALRKLGFQEFTEPQLRAIPRILAGKSVLVIAPTGVGKTEAAILPILHRILTEKPEPVSCLYITPLRALNRDMLRRMTFFGEELGVRVAVRHGDTPPKDRAEQTRHPPDILITTPETFQILFTGRRVRDQLRTVRWVVVDEIHELAGDDRGGQLAVALERLAELIGHDVQRIGLSATVGSPDEVAGYLGGVGREVEVIRTPIPKGIKIQVEFPLPAPEDLAMAERLHLQEVQASSLRRCHELIGSHRSTLFFVNTRDAAEFLSSRMRLSWPEASVGVHHGSLSKEVRVQMEDDFKAGVLKSLICTSSLELGIDVGSADFVLQYNSPREVTRLVQRIGRSGHGVGEVSDGLVVATHEDDFAEASVIARRALAEELEPLVVRQDNLAVLANQLVSMAMTRPSYSEDEAYALVRRAYPFRDLKKPDFTDVLEQLAALRRLWHTEGRFGRTPGSRLYFLENISMIPDVRTYRVVDMVSRRVIGTLDEWFVAENAKLGASFVMRGTTWRFVELKEDHLLVEPVREIGDVPSWIGEDIPVSFAVAQEVGRLRGSLDFSGHPGNDEGVRRFQAYIKGLAGKPVPTDTRVTIEVARDLVIINACFGSRVNETLAQLISSLISARFGQSVGVQADPYRVIVEAPASIDPQRVIEILKPEDPDALEPLLRVVLKNSAYLRWAFVFVAKKFGALRREVDWESISVPRLLKAFENTPLFEEVLNRIFWERMDLPRTAEVLRRIKTGAIAVEVTQISNVGKAGLEGSLRLVAPQKADHATLMAVKARLEKETAQLLCLNCRTSWRSLVADLPAKIACPTCNGAMVAALRHYERDKAKDVDFEMPSKADRPVVKKLFTNASLVMGHGKRAVLALVARGVGEETAARILRGYHETEDDFLRDVLAAEVNYARTKRFWD